MLDEFDKPLEQEDDEYGEDAEVPILPYPSKTSSRKLDTEPKIESSQRYIRIALERLRFLKVIFSFSYATAKSSAFWTAIATVVIAIATVIYTHYSGQQWGVMTRQLDDFEASQRANITIQNFEASWPEGPNAPIYVTCAIQNSGSTVATNIGIGEGNSGGNAIGIGRDWFGRGKRFSIPILVTGIPHPSETMGPSLGANQKKDCGWTVGPFDTEQASQIRVGDMWQAVTISVSYKDVFGKSWIANDCLIYQPWRREFTHCPMKTNPAN